MSRALLLVLLVVTGCKKETAARPSAGSARDGGAPAKVEPAAKVDARAQVEVPTEVEATAVGTAWIDALIAGEIDVVVTASSFPFTLELVDLDARAGCPEGEMKDAAALRAALTCVSDRKLGVIGPLSQKQMEWSATDLAAPGLPAFVSAWRVDHAFVERMPDGTGADPEFVRVVVAVHRAGGSARVHGVELTHVVEEGD